MKNLNHSILTASLFLGLCSCAFAQSSYDAPETGTVGGLGAGGYSVFGQSFNTPTGGYTTMVDFSFWIAANNGNNGASGDTFLAEVSQWNGSAPVGSPIYTDNLGPMTFGPTFTQITFNPNIALTPGDQYIAEIVDVTGSSYFDFEANLGHPAGDGGGNMVFNEGGIWANYAAIDMAWHADFTNPSASPEPFTIGLGIAGVGMAVRRRMKPKV